MKQKSRVTVLICLFMLALGQLGCERAEEPYYVNKIVLKGNAYDRGYTHGRVLSGDVRSLHTRLLTTSIVPYLNREQSSIAPVLTLYNTKPYRDGLFSYKMLLESGQDMYDTYLSEEYRQELKGLADGSGLSLDEIIIMNTFFDTMMGFRAIVMFIQGIQEPYITELDFGEAMASDGFDNNANGEIDEENEGFLTNYESSPYATLLEVPTGTAFKLTLEDPTLLGLGCVDPRNIEPFGEWGIEARCVLKTTCLKSRCADLDMLTEDCFRKEGDEEDDPDNKEEDADWGMYCLDPRVAGDCLDPNCVEPTDPGCVNPDSIRITMHTEQPDGTMLEHLFVAGDSALVIEHVELPEEDRKPSPYPDDYPHAVDCMKPMRITFTPPSGFAEATVVSLKIQAGDLAPVWSPAPYHNRYMRDERITFTTAGYFAKNKSGDQLYQVTNKGGYDKTAQPPSIGFGVRGSATTSGDPIIGHHYSLLDNDLVHKHSVIFTHVPEKGHPHVIVGWAGLIWGFSGMNDQGMTFTFTNSDSLDNPVLGEALGAIFEPENLIALLANPDLVGLANALKAVKMKANGLPIGIAGREALRVADTAAEGRDFLYGTKRTYGWNVMLADASGDMMVVELDSATRYERPDPDDGLTKNEDGFMYYTPDESDEENVNKRGERYASLGPDDIRMSSHYQKNLDDMVDLSIMGQFAPRMQRNWTGFYMRSIRSYWILGDEIESRLGNIDVAAAIDILREPNLVDQSNSMSAAIFEPKKQILHWAMGAGPATDAPFISFDLNATLRENGVK